MYDCTELTQLLIFRFAVLCTSRLNLRDLVCSNNSTDIFYYKRFLCFISLLIYYTIPQHKCYSNKYEMYNLSDNLVSAVPLHSVALRGQPASLHTAPTTSVIVHKIMHAALQLALL